MWMCVAPTAVSRIASGTFHRLLWNMDTGWYSRW